MPPATATVAAGNAAAGASPAAATAAGGGVTSRSPAPPAPSAGGGAAGGTSTFGGKVAFKFELTVLVVMNGIGRFLGPDVGTGDRIDDEAEDVELHHTSCVSPSFAHRNDNSNQQTFKSISWKQWLAVPGLAIEKDYS